MLLHIFRCMYHSDSSCDYISNCNSKVCRSFIQTWKNWIFRWRLTWIFFNAARFWPYVYIHNRRILLSSSSSSWRRTFVGMPLSCMISAIIDAHSSNPVLFEDRWLPNQSLKICWKVLHVRLARIACHKGTVLHELLNYCSIVKNLFQQLSEAVLFFLICYIYE